MLVELIVGFGSVHVPTHQGLNEPPHYISPPRPYDQYLQISGMYQPQCFSRGKNSCTQVWSLISNLQRSQQLGDNIRGCQAWQEPDLDVPRAISWTGHGNTNCYCWEGICRIIQYPESSSQVRHFTPPEERWYAMTISRNPEVFCEEWVRSLK